MNAPFTAQSSLTVADMRPWLAVLHARLHWSGKRGLYVVPVLKPWQRWRERRGVGLRVWRHSEGKHIG